MRIVGLAASIPQRIINNDEVLDLIKYYSIKLTKRELTQALLSMEKLFIQVGSKTRHWRLTSERPLDLIVEAWEKALRVASFSHGDIDVFIYCSIHRGFLEPATASFICQKLGLKCRRTFDVLDACMGWCTALEIAQLYLDNNGLKTAAIISSEFPYDKNGILMPRCFQINNLSDVNIKIAGLTMGECATVTIVSSDSNEQWSFFRKEVSEYASLCSVPLRNYEMYTDEYQGFDENWVETFYAKASELGMRGFRPSLDVMKQYCAKYGQPTIIIPHSVSDILPRRAANKLSLKGRIFSTFSELGNLATASLSASLLVGINRHAIECNDNIAGWIGSAGMKFSAFPIVLNSSLFKKETEPIMTQGKGKIC